MKHSVVTFQIKHFEVNGTESIGTQTHTSYSYKYIDLYENEQEFCTPLT